MAHIFKMTFFLKLFLGLSLLGIFGGGLTAFGIYQWVLKPELPDVKTLKNVQYQVPLQIYSTDGQLISEIGTKKRLPVEYEQIPPTMIQAIISSEDDGFFEHDGVDFNGIFRAVYTLATTGQKAQGGSTITMQVARNFFLTREKTYLRKINEIILSYQIENALSKEEIITLYLNKIFLGYRSYGVAAAAQTYYGKSLSELDLNEFAMIAGLPKAPSAYNPIINPERAEIRRNYVLRRMHELGFISQDDFIRAKAVPVHAKFHGVEIELDAGYVAEMVRQKAQDILGEEATTGGYRIYTTVQSHLQETANIAMQKGLMDYVRRHDYQGALAHKPEWLNVSSQELRKHLKEFKAYGILHAGIVSDVLEQGVIIRTPDRIFSIAWKDMKWARMKDGKRWLPKPKKPSDILKKGDIIYAEPVDPYQLDGDWMLADKPEAQGALVSLNPHDGSILALNGGFDYQHSKFNRAVQGLRQPGSNFKPFIYSAALEKGYTAASLINDAPLVFKDKALEDFWKPENYSGKFFGPTRIRYALTKSRNLVSIRLLRNIGIRFALNHAQQFGFNPARFEGSRNLSLSLGSAPMSPLEVAQGYSVFANGGLKIEPHIIDRIEDINGKVVYQYFPPSPLDRAISEQNAFIMTSIMKDVITEGTGRKALALNRGDIAGKTGTTNDQKDAWFSGFSPDVVTTVWVGFDQPKTMGRFETGGRAALPIWIDFMEQALISHPEKPETIPEGIVRIKINPKTGDAAYENDTQTIYEVFRTEHAPKPKSREHLREQELIRELF